MEKAPQPLVLLLVGVAEDWDMLNPVLTSGGYDVLLVSRAEEVLKTAIQKQPNLILVNVVLPETDGFSICRVLKADALARDIPVIFLTAQRDEMCLAQGVEAGAVDFIFLPIQKEEVLVRVQTHLEIGRLARLLTKKNEDLENMVRALQQSNGELQMTVARLEEAEEARIKTEGRLKQLSKKNEDWWGTARMCGESRMVRQILKEVAQLQNRDNTSVLIVGESGAGKELVARAIHLGGVRAKGPFVPVNCAAIPNDLAEASFFGHVRGAFTGADRDRKGFFELADGGTLFLDEVSDMPLTLQAKLLRVLEDRIVQPVGSSQAIRVDVRVVAATNADLMAKVTTGQFRRDLYYRLAVMPVRVPPLRERKDDLPLLVDHFLSLFAHEMRIPVPTLSLEALQVLQAYNFPGNVRELKNMIEFALIRSEGNMLLPAHLPETGVGVVTESVSDPARPLVGSEATRVLAYVQKHGSIGNAECCDLLKVNRRHATLVLNKLCDAEKLAKTGSRRWTRYQLLAN